MILVALLLGALMASETSEPIDFDSQVLPVLTKAGCNAGACHGAAAGRGGFHLSLFGSDPQSDYDAVVAYAEGRRINIVDISRSLFLAKPLGHLDHGGDIVLREGTSDVAILRRWLEQGAKRGGKRQLKDLRVEPHDATVKTMGDSIALRAIALFSDGTEEDVTQWTQFRSNDTLSVEIASEPMRALCLRPGKHLVMARFWNRIIPVSISLPFDGPIVTTGVGGTSRGLVDNAIDAQLKKLNLVAMERVDDASLLRRWQLDLTGRLPLPNELWLSPGESSDANREQVLSRLLDSVEFSEFWGLRMARRFRMRGLPTEPRASQAYSEWIVKSILERRPYDQVVREMLTATGDSHVNGPANFTRSTVDARQHAELVCSVLMGTRIQCANCHNHPFARWTQDDYHGLAAIFARFDRSRYVSLKELGAVTNVRTGESAIPRIPGVRDLESSGSALEQFTDWLLDKDNPYFAKATVNWIWDALMGRGLVAGVDDFRETNPASHSQLLDELARDFSMNGYDLRRTIRLIASSDAYARRTDVASTSSSMEPWYGVATRKTLLPEVHLDAIDDVLGYDENAKSKNRQRAILRLDPSVVSPELDVLGRCPTNQACQSVGPRQGLAPKLHAINGELLNGRIAHQEGRLRRYLRDGMTPRAVIEDFYARALATRPTREQLDGWIAQLGELTPEAQAQWLEDFVWAIVTSQDFTMNR